uniref:Predicted tRNA/rRNA methyltransferase n=1 Tax=uncultured marine alpha proteobacterium HOT2C01 TaxID=248049 RepID=Q6UCQ6_9PROT|nr:predicted tRNA/rRNA methyltransferase [uncultured marine alpha proteobacterium HOT2C01]
MSKRSKKLPKKRQNSDYWIYGHHAVVGALMNENRVKYEVYFTSEAEKKLKNEIKLENINVISIKKTRDEIDLLLKGISNHQGICMRVEKLQTPKLSDFINNLNEERSIIFLLDQLDDPQNVGAIFRSALAFNIDGIILTNTNSVTENSFLAKTASSALDKVPFIKIQNISSCIKILKDSGYWIYGLDMKAERSITETTFPKKIVFILGSESKGMRKITDSLCDEGLKIKMSDNLESLNVSNTAAIIMFYVSNINLKS